MPIDVEKLVEEMTAPAATILAAKWPEIRIYAETEFRKLAQTLLAIERLKVAGQIGQEEALILVDMQKTAMRSVMITLEGLGLLIVERTINAALAAIREPVQKALGWALI